MSGSTEAQSITMGERSSPGDDPRERCIPACTNNAQSVQDHAEEVFSWRAELFGDRRSYAKAIDLLMIAQAAAGSADQLPAQTAAYEAALQAASLTESLKNAAGFPLAQDKTVKAEYSSQILSEDTTQNVLDKAMRQVSESMTQEISRVVMDALDVLASALRAQVDASELAEGRSAQG